MTAKRTAIIVRRQPVPGIALRSEEDETRVIKGNLILRENTTYSKGINLIVEGDVKGSNGVRHSLTVLGNLKVMGNLECDKLSVKGISAEVAGTTRVAVLDAYTFEGRKIMSGSLLAWNVRADEIQTKSGNVGFVACEKISYGPRFRFDRILKNKRKYENEGAADGKDVVFPKAGRRHRTP